MKTSNLCPFNNMSECIGENCAMFIDATTVATTVAGKKPVHALLKSTELQMVPCAIAFSGLASFYSYASRKLSAEESLRHL